MMKHNEATTTQKIIASLLGLVILVIIIHFFYTRSMINQYEPNTRKMLSKMEQLNKQ